MHHTPYSNIPEELRLLNQWVLWKLEDIGAAKPTKVPYSVRGHAASVTDPSHWGTFEECFNKFQTGGYDGLGFVFSKADPYTFIDLDDAEGDDAILQRHLKVYHEFNTYAEVSPSGKGLHLICKGTVPAGRRRSKIEIYPHDRYATMTGNAYGGRLHIGDCQAVLTQLWEQMGSGPVAQSMYNGADKEKESDDVIIERATLAINGDKFIRLHKGEWQDFYNSQSEADFAYIDIIAFYTQNRLQISRIFRASGLGSRDKAKRNDYVSGMISRSFDRMLPPLDFDGLKNAIETKLAEPELPLDGGKINGNQRNGICDIHSTTDSINTGAGIRDKINGHDAHITNSDNSTISSHNNSNGNALNGMPAVPIRDNPVTDSSVPLELPPGLVGELAQFIYQAAPRPVREVALSAAIALMAGITGRAYNISGTGLNQYVLLLAMTGAGKEAAASGINKLMNTIKMQVPSSTSFIGPSEISSGSALFKYLGNTSQSFISLLGEFGLRLQQMSSPNANGSEVSLRRMFLDLYNKSGHSEILHASVYSDKANNTSAVPSPSFSILGESTPERFYGALNEDMISEGLLPRFLLIEYKGERPPLNEHHTSVVPSFSVIERLAALAAQCESINHSNPRRVINVERDPEAAKMLTDFEIYSTKIINSSNREVMRQLWNRAHMKVLKLSALLAVGENMLHPIINTGHVVWSANLVQSDVNALLARFEAGEVGSNSFEIKQTNEIIRMIRDYLVLPYDKVEKYIQFKSPQMHQDRVIPYVYLNKRLAPLGAFKSDRAGATVAVKRAIQNLVDSDRIKEISKIYANDKYGTSQRCFVVNDLSILE